MAHLRCRKFCNPLPIGSAAGSSAVPEAVHSSSFIGSAEIGEACESSSGKFKYFNLS